MGAVHFSIDPGLVRRLAVELPIEVFVETGTYEGASVNAVTPFFNEIHTIELSDELYAQAEEAFSELSEVQVHHGRSQEILKELAPQLKGRKTMFWLDAHWSDEPGSAGEAEPCPLLDELEAIGSLEPESVVMIDDARLFLAPPPPPADPDQWPSLDQVLAGLSSLSESHEPMVIDDVIVFFPASVKEAVREYAREHGAEWFAELGRARETNVRLDRLESRLEAIPRDVIPAQISDLELGLGHRFEAIQHALAELRADSATTQEAISQMRLVEARQEIRALEHRLGDLGSQLESVQRGAGELSKASKATQKAIGEARAAGHEEGQRLLARVESLGPELDHRLEAVAAQLRDLQEQRPQIEEVRRQLQDVQQQGPQLERVQRQLEAVSGHGTQIAEVRRQLEEVRAHRPNIEEIQRMVTLLSEPVIARRRRRANVANALMAPARAVGFVLAPVARPLRPLWARLRWAGGAVRQHTGVWLARLRPEPKLGRLQHHPPTEMNVPKRYLNSNPPQNPPSISIVTPSFNQEPFIERTIRSVVEQKYPRLQYFVQDGDSSDGTRGVLERFDSQLDSWEMRPDDGQAHALNLGFAHAEGEVMAYLNSDDLLLPGALRYVGRYFEANPDVDVIYGHRVLIDDNDREIGRWVLPRHRDSILSWADYIPQETLFWRRGAWEVSGGRVDEDFRFALDWDLLIRMRDAGARIVRVPRFLGAFRVHTAQKTSAELEMAGAKEMALIREREHHREVSAEEVDREIRGYLRRHVALHKLYRAGLIRY